MRIKRSVLAAATALLAIACTDATGPGSQGIDLQLNLVGPASVSQAELDAISDAFSLVDRYVIDIVDSSNGALVAGAQVDITPSATAAFHILDVTVPEDALGLTVTVTLIAYGGGIELYRSVTQIVLTAGLGQSPLDLEVRYTGPGIRGMIVDDQGAPLSGVAVDLYVGQALVDQATTEADGTYVFPNAAPGLHQVVPTPPAGVSFVCPAARDVVVQTNVGVVANFVASGALCTVDVLVASGGDFDDNAAVKAMLDQDPTLTTTTFYYVNQLPGIDELSKYDVVLLYANGLFGESVALGTEIADYVALGGNVVVASFYWQVRGDSNLGSPGWGTLEAIDPFTTVLGAQTQVGGATYQNGDLNGNTIVPHPLTAGITSVTSTGFWGGVAAKPTTTVLAEWTDIGQGPQPFIGYQILPSGQRVVGVSIFPASGTSATGDWQTAFTNAVGWAGAAGGPL